MGDLGGVVFWLVVVTGTLGLLALIGLNLLWNGTLLFLRALTSLSSLAQARPIKWLPAHFYWTGLIAFLVVGSVVSPDLLPHHDGTARNSGVQANAHTVQLAVEQYALDHHGKYPEALRELFPHYLERFPRTPWNTQQSADIPAIYATNLNSVYKRTLGPGRSEDPTCPNDFGAIGYARLGAEGKHYVITGTGRRGEEAVIVFVVTNL